MSRPWKNGGGETSDVVVVPSGAGFDDFDYRVSIATVASDGPFSKFSGIDRSLAVLSGAGMMLAFDGAAPVLVDRGSPILEFKGETPVSARLVRGPLRDLNVMSRRTKERHRLLRLSLAAGEVRQFSADRAVLVWMAGDGEINADAFSARPGLEDAVVFDTTATWQIIAVTHVIVFFAEFFPPDL